MPSDSEPEADGDDFGDLWESWENRWEQEFQRFSTAEDARIERAAEFVHRVAGQDACLYQASVETAVHRGDEAARRISRLTNEVEHVEHEVRVAEVRDNARQARSDAVGAALQSADDMVREIADRAGNRRKEREAKRKEERRAYEAAADAKFKKFQAEQEASSKSNEDKYKYSADEPGFTRPRDADRAGTGGAREPPRFTRVPGAHAAAAAAHPTIRPPKRLETFSAFDAAWKDFEKLAGKREGALLGYDDVPWPTLLPTVSGVVAGDGKPERKRKLKDAVLRWHPDKWGRMLDRIRDEERSQVMERVKEVTRRILDERRKFAP